MKNDLRYALRVLGRSPGFTVVAVLALALGIGANTAIFTVVNAVLLRALPFPDAERLVIGFAKTRNFPRGSPSWPDFLDWRARNRTFQEMASYRNASFNLTGVNEPARLFGKHVSAPFLKVLGIEPSLGRFFTTEEDQPGAEKVAVLTYSCWQQRFGGDAKVLGRSILIDAAPTTIIGVLPPAYAAFSRQDEILVPQGLIAGTPWQRARNNHTGIVALGRLKPGVTFDQAREDLVKIAADLEKEYPESNTGGSANAELLSANLVRTLRTPLLVLTGAVGFVLLIACVNVANLMLARATGRQREMAVRAALGAARWRLMRQLTAESLLVAAFGGLAGVLMAVWGLDALLAVAPERIRAIDGLGLDWRVLGFTALLTISTGLLFGLAPALSASRADLARSLAQRASTGNLPGRRLRNTLLIGEVALTVALLVGAGLMIRTLERLYQSDPGFQHEKLLTMRYQLTGRDHWTDADRAPVHQQIVEETARVPGVISAAVGESVPMRGTNWTSVFMAADKPVPARADLPTSIFDPVSPGYFRTMGIKLLRGRLLTDADTGSAPKVCVISDALARAIWPGEDAIGKRMRQGFPESKAPWIEVVGVVSNIKQDGLDDKGRMQTYWPMAQTNNQSMNLIVRTAGDPMSVARSVEKAIHAFLPDLPLYNATSMDQVIAGSVADRRFSMIMLGCFAGLALLLAAVGIYGVISYTVAQRTQEIGVRVALGASSGQVLKSVIGSGMLLVGIGLLAGLAGSIALTDWMSTMLYEVKPSDPLTLAVVTAVLAFSALIACVVPARRALRVDPIEALRQE
jgi:putative ABC transport system permease protein